VATRACLDSVAASVSVDPPATTAAPTITVQGNSFGFGLLCGIGRIGFILWVLRPDLARPVRTPVVTSAPSALGELSVSSKSSSSRSGPLADLAVDVDTLDLPRRRFRS